MSRMLLLITAMCISLSAPVAAHAQFGGAPGADGLKSLFGGETMPLSKKLKELDGNWRRITIGGAPGEGKGMLGGLGGFFGMMMGGAGANHVAPPASYFTQGTIVNVGQEAFLVTYRHQTKGVDFAELVAQAGQGGPPKLPDPEKLAADTDLQMTLLNVRSIQSISGIRPFNLDVELAEAQKDFEKEIALRKQMEAGPFGGLGGAAVAVPEEPMVEDMPVAPKPAPKKAAPKKPAPKRK